MALDEDNNIIALSLNRIDYVDRDKNIPAFAEAVAGKDIFMNKILEFMEVLYQVVDQIELINLNMLEQYIDFLPIVIE